MIRRMSLWFAIVMMIVTITGCGQNAAAGKGGIKIFFSLNEADTFRQTLVDGAAEQAAQMGGAVCHGGCAGLLSRSRWLS